MTECLNCNSKVSATFARVYGDNDNNIYRCIHCVEEGEGGRRILHHGGGAIPDKETIEERMKTGL